MKEVLIDTIVFDFLNRNKDAVSKKAIEVILKADIVYVSVTSLWELSAHVKSGEIPLNSEFEIFYQKSIQTLGLVLLDTQWSALNYLSTFEFVSINKQFKNKDGELGVKSILHKDPFDRMLIAHAISMKIPIVSPDSLFPYYKHLGLEVIW